MIQDELDKAKGRKILDSTHERTELYWVYFQLSAGRRMVLSSEAPIRVEVETEQ